MPRQAKQIECLRCKGVMDLVQKPRRCPECEDGQTYLCPQCGTRVWADDIGCGLARYCVLPEESE